MRCAPIEKVVAIANLSPGIVRFYFKSKADTKPTDDDFIIL